MQAGQMGSESSSSEIHHFIRSFKDKQPLEQIYIWMEYNQFYFLNQNLH